MNDGRQSQPDLSQKYKLHLRMGREVQLWRGIHVGSLRGETSPRNRLGDIRRVAGDSIRRWFPAGRPHLGGSDFGIAMCPYNSTHHTQVTFISIQWRI